MRDLHTTLLKHRRLTNNDIKQAYRLTSIGYCNDQSEASKEINTQRNVKCDLRATPLLGNIKMSAHKDCRGKRSVSLGTSHFYSTHTKINLGKINENNRYNIADKSAGKVDSILHRERRGNKIASDRLNERRRARKAEQLKKQESSNTNGTFANPNESTASKESSCSIM